jgi:hypothetical protein
MTSNILFLPLRGKEKWREKEKGELLKTNGIIMVTARKLEKFSNTV